MKKDSVLVHAGRDPARHAGMVNVPVYRTSTVLFSDLAAFEESRGDKFAGVRYGRYGTPTAFALEAAMAALEGGYRAMVAPSGVAAIATALTAFVKPGDHVLVPDVVFPPTRHFCDTVMTRNGVETTHYAPGTGGAIAALIRPNTRLVYCESPGSDTFEMEDVPALAAAAHAAGLPVLADNTWATPYFFPAFARGVDVSIHAATKYVVGHSDAMLGVIVANERHWRTIRTHAAEHGTIASPDDCYLALRGLRTLGLRMRHHHAAGLEVARWLARQPAIAQVLHPGLPDHPGHAIWARDYEGASGLFGVLLKPATPASVREMIDSLALFGIGSSWGGYESLILPRTVTRTATSAPQGPLLRLHIGLEDTGDLIADLARGLAHLVPADAP